MSTDILLRSVLAIAFILIGALGYWLVNQRLLVRARNNIFTLLSSVEIIW